MLAYHASAAYAGAKRGAAALLATLAMLLAMSPAAIAEPTVIGVDGTMVQLPVDLSPVLGDVLDFNHGAFKTMPGYTVVTNDYPRSFGILTLGGPNYDDSVAVGKAGAINTITQAQHGDASIPVTLVCLSQGSDVCTQANAQLSKAGYSQTSVTYWLLGNVDNATGAKSRMNIIGVILGHEVFIPGPGVTLGNSAPTTGSDARIYQVSYEYDGFARAPKYPINLLADINAIAGTALEHGSYAQADPNAPGNYVSTTPDDKITNIVIPVNEVPLLTVARMVGLPQPVADIVNPVLKAVIDTAYEPMQVGPGAYPATAQPFGLFPSVSELRADVKNVQKGMRQSGDKLAASLRPLVATLPKPSVVKSGNLFKPGSLPSAVGSNPINRASKVATGLHNTVATVTKRLAEQVNHGAPRVN